MIIVYYNKNIGVDFAYAVESLVNKPVVERAVADNGDYVEVLALYISRLGNSERRGN